MPGAVPSSAAGWWVWKAWARAGPGPRAACPGGGGAGGWGRRGQGRHRLVEHLLEAEADVVICDVNAAAVEAVRARHPEVRAVPGIEALLAEDLDILAPCALGGTLTDQVASRLTARIVC